MEKKRRVLAAFLSVILLVGFLPFKASANSAPPPPYFVIRLTNLPEEAVYADLLIPMDPKNEKYVEADRDHLLVGFTEDSEILDYCADGYLSYTFHYRDAISSISVNEEGEVIFFADAEFFTDWSGEANFYHQNEITDLGYIRIAILDKNGNVLEVSPVLEVHNKAPYSSLRYEFSYDAAAKKFNTEYDTSYFGKYLYRILAFLGMLLTCIAEFFVSIPFGLRKQYQWMILLTNIVSQILMHALYLGLYGLVFWKYKYVVIVLEILIYAGEYLWYSHRMCDVPKKKVLAYTVAANTVSLAIGWYTIYSLIL